MPRGDAVVSVRPVGSATDDTPTSDTPLDDTRSDAALLSAHLGGDRHAFAELIDRHRPRLYRLARGRSQTAEDADDALQDALLAAHRHAGDFRHDAAVGSWLHRIVVNACLDRLRRNAARPTVTLTDDDRTISDHAISDHAAGVETAVVVRQALMRLPAAQRAAVMAVDMQGYSVAEAALLLGVPDGTVKSRCARARSRLAVLLRPLAPATET